MRAPTLVIVLILCFATLAGAQDWTDFQTVEDGFKVNFPSEPKTITTTWTTEQGYVLPSRVYSADTAGGRFSMTVVDYRIIDRLGMERSEKCPEGAETCQGQPAGGNRGLIGPGYATTEIRDAMFYATSKYLQREGRVTQYLWTNENIVEGHELHMTNADQSRTLVYVTMHENRLYILDGTVPKGYPEPHLFIDSLGFVDKDGHAIRYRFIYSNSYHGLRLYPLPPPAAGN